MTKTQIIQLMFAGLIGAAMTVTAVPARANAPACAPREDMIERLSTIFGETRRGMGLGTGNQVLEVFASAESGSWTVTVTLPDGRMCLVASGQAWEDRMDDLAHLSDVKT